MKPVIHICLLLLFMQCTCMNTPGVKPMDRKVIACMNDNPTLYDLGINKPVLKLNVPADSIKSLPEILSIQIKEVKNPAKLPVSLQVAFISSFHKWPIANFTLYPADRPGEFTFRITKESVAMKKELLEKTGSVFFIELLLDTAAFKDAKQAGKDSLKIKLCSPVFKQGTEEDKLF